MSCGLASNLFGAKLFLLYIYNLMARKPTTKRTRKTFHIDFLNPAQKEAYNCFCDNDVTFLLGPAGVGKSYLATAFAINEILSKRTTV